MYLNQMGLGMPIIARMREIIAGERQNILELINNNNHKNNGLIPVDGKEIIDYYENETKNIENLVREEEESDRRAEQAYRKQLENRVF